MFRPLMHQRPFDLMRVQKRLSQGEGQVKYSDLKINNLIQAKINNGSKDYDLEYIRNHVEKLIS